MTALDLTGQIGLQNKSIAQANSLSTATKGAKNVEQAKKTAEDFESFFLSQMFENMFAGVSTEGPFGGGNSEKIFRSMMLDEYGKMISKNGYLK